MSDVRPGRSRTAHHLTRLEQWIDAHAHTVLTAALFAIGGVLVTQAILELTR